MIALGTLFNITVYLSRSGETVWRASFGCRLILCQEGVIRIYHPPARCAEIQQALAHFHPSINQQRITQNTLIWISSPHHAEQSDLDFIT